MKQKSRNPTVIGISTISSNHGFNKLFKQTSLLTLSADSKACD